jgi:hypothetical protein
MRGTRAIRRLAVLLLAALVLALPACSGDGQFCFLGYTTAPNYDMSIRTVYVPIFKNTTLRRGLEFYLTEAVVREIESKTPYKVASCQAGADTELVGTVVSRSKMPTVMSQLGEVRDIEATLTVELHWRDLRPDHTGEQLAMVKPHRADDPPPPPGVKQPPVVVQALVSFEPELGVSLAVAEKIACDRLAVQIVSAMEKAW